MLILACDTSNTTCCAGVYDDGREIAYEVSFEMRTHSETFMPLLHRVMEKAGIRHSDLDAYAICVGPGSFTGIRIGLSAVKGMSAASGVPCIAVSSTEALARSVTNVVHPEERTILVPAFDARNKRVFAGVYSNHDYEVRIEEGAYAADDLADKIALLPDVMKSKLIVLGSGAEAMKDALSGKLGINADYAAGAMIMPVGIDAAARAAVEKTRGTAIQDAAAIKASYCAVSSAERYRKPV
ncbi:MAG: tRNA (adenosine(37)-N6)-threonylcarbamoyltransferase complex dimerization subunit type 1 TsaB [Clostridiales bacterium]|nr:tRNA (adenosine(37)-N6)-threonylcarbamoyltransferase complex dimerization subunit type 1 TsaB [Clostridiales bacterium]